MSHFLCGQLLWCFFDRPKEDKSGKIRGIHVNSKTFPNPYSDTQPCESSGLEFTEVGATQTSSYVLETNNHPSKTATYTSDYEMFHPSAKIEHRAGGRYSQLVQAKQLMNIRKRKEGCEQENLQVFDVFVSIHHSCSHAHVQGLLSSPKQGLFKTWVWSRG